MFRRRRSSAAEDAVNPDELGNEVWAEIEHRIVEMSGIRMHVTEKGRGSAPVVLLLHGVPEIWYAWRRQIVGLAADGYHAVAPDLRGFGDTTVPSAAASYSVLRIVGDLVALIDSLGEEKVTVTLDRR